MKSRRSFASLLLLVVAAGILPLASHGQVMKKATGVSAPPQQGDSSRVNRNEIVVDAVAPYWQLKTVTGETVRLAELRGKVVVLDFWASWCGPCRKLIPAYEQLAREYQNQPVKFYSISIWPGPGFDPQTFLQEHKLASTLLIGNDAVANSYGVWSVPTLFVIDPQGKFAYINVPRVVDPEALANQLRETIAQVLPKQQPAQTANPCEGEMNQ